MKLAVIFPGIGYHTDKPLLYYSKKLARSAGFEVREIGYGALPDGILDNPERLHQAARQALDAAEAQLAGIDWTGYTSILFVSKSIGTVIASLIAARHGLSPFHFYFTPVGYGLSRLQGKGIVFHGTADPWAATEAVTAACREKSLQLHLTGHANHSLETGNVQEDLRELRRIMALCEDYLRTL